MVVLVVTFEDLGSKYLESDMASTLSTLMLSVALPLNKTLERLTSVGSLSISDVSMFHPPLSLARKSANTPR